MSQPISKMETTQTAVEFLKDRLESILELYNSEWDKVYQVLEQAKAIEKEQMHKCASFWRGKENEIEKPMFDIYYKETYGL